MPLSATFSADFSSFQSAVQKAETSLKSFEGGASKVESQLNRMSDSLSGVKIVQAATISAEAVERLGGVSKLTDAELKRVGATAQEAADKLQRMGQEVPPGIQKIASAAAEAQNKTQSFNDSLRATIPTTSTFIEQAKGVALGFVSGAVALETFMRVGHGVVDFFKDSIKEASEADLIQRKLNAALEAQGTAIPTVVKQFDELAGKYQNLTVNSDEAIKSAATLLVQVGNVLPAQMDRALQATTNLSAGLGIDLNSAAMLVSKAFEDNFNALKKAGVQIDTTRAQAEGMSYVLGQIEQRFGGQAIAEAQSYEGQIKQLGNTFTDLEETLGRAALSTGALQFAIALAKAEITKAEGEIRGIIATLELLPTVAARAGIDLPGLLKAMGFEAAKANPALEQTNTLINSYASAMRNAGQASRDTTAKIKDDAKDIKEAAQLELGEWADTVKRHQQEYKDAEKEVTDYLDKQDNDRLADAKAALDEWGDLIKRHASEYKSAEEEITAFLKQQEDDRVLVAKNEMEAWSELVKRHKDEEKDANEKIVADLKERQEAVGKTLDQIARAFSQLAQVSGGTFGGIAKDIAIVVNSMDTGYKAFSSLHDAIKKGKADWSDYATAIAAGVAALDSATASGSRTQRVLSGAASGAVTGMAFGPWGALVGAGVGAVVGAFRDIDNAQSIAFQNFEKYSAMFAKTDRFGVIQTGAKSLQQQLESLGDVGKRMWQDLYGAAMQGDIAKVNTLIGQINVSLRQQAKEQEEAARAAQQAAADALQDDTDLRAAMEKYKFSIEDMGQAFKQSEMNKEMAGLLNSFRLLAGAGANSDEVLRRMADDVNKFTQRGKAMGIEFDFNMKPMLQRMLDMGLLLDENGNKLEDLSGFSFNRTLGQEFDRLISKLDELIDKLGLKLPTKLAETAEDPNWEAIKKKFDMWATAADGVADSVYGIKSAMDSLPSTPGDDTSGPPVVVVPKSAGLVSAATLAPSARSSVSSASAIHVNIDARGALFGNGTDREMARRVVSHLKGLGFGS